MASRIESDDAPYVADLTPPEHSFGPKTEVVQRVVAKAQSTYKSFAHWSLVKAEHRDVKAQFKIVKQQGIAFDKTMKSSVDVCVQGIRLADDGQAMCDQILKPEDGSDHMVILGEMIVRAKKGAEEAQKVKEGLHHIQITLMEVFAAIPDVTHKIESDLAAIKHEKAESQARRSLICEIFAWFHRRNKAKVEELEHSLEHDQTEYESLQNGLQGIIEAVSALLSWWDESVEKLKKLKDDGDDVQKSKRAFTPPLAIRMRREWGIVHERYKWYREKVFVLSETFHARVKKRRILS